MTTDNKNTLIAGLALAGNVTGIVLGVKRHSGFWGTVGWMMLGGLAGGAVGYITTAMFPTEEKLSLTIKTGT